MAAEPEWVELTKANGEIDAHLIGGSLHAEGIETHLEKHPGVWRYGASDPFALVSIYVRPARLSEARELLARVDPSFDGLQEAGEAEWLEPPDPFIRRRPLRWWLAALVVGGLLLALIRFSVADVIF